MIRWDRFPTRFFEHFGFGLPTAGDPAAAAEQAFLTLPIVFATKIVILLMLELQPQAWMLLFVPPEHGYVSCRQELSVVFEVSKGQSERALPSPSSQVGEKAVGEPQLGCVLARNPRVFSKKEVRIVSLVRLPSYQVAEGNLYSQLGPRELPFEMPAVVAPGEPIHQLLLRPSSRNSYS